MEQCNGTPGQHGRRKCPGESKSGRVIPRMDVLGCLQDYSEHGMVRPREAGTLPKVTQQAGPTLGLEPRSLLLSQAPSTLPGGCPSTIALPTGCQALLLPQLRERAGRGGSVVQRGRREDGKCQLIQISKCHVIPGAFSLLPPPSSTPPLAILRTGCRAAGGGGGLPETSGSGLVFCPRIPVVG